MKRLKQLIVLMSVNLMMWIGLSPAFQHPEMTQTQLLVEYWPIYLGLILSLFLTLGMWRTLE